METYNNQGKKPYSVERFATHPEVIKTRSLINEGLEHFVHDLHEQVHPGIDQGIVFETQTSDNITPIRNSRIFQVGGAIANAAIGESGDLSTYHEVAGSTIPLRGTALETQIYRSKKRNSPSPTALVAASALNPEQRVLGFPIKSSPEHIIGMAQIAISRDTALSIAAIESSRANSYKQLGLSKARILWQDYNQIIGEQVNKLHDLHEEYDASAPYFEALELATPKVAPNSIALTYDLANSTERAMAMKDGSFAHFLNSWKRNVEKIIDYHDLTDKTELIGDLGDGYSVIFWLDEKTNIYDDESLEAFRDLVVDPFNRNIHAMSSELAEKYTSELGPLTFESAETPTFSQINTPTDLSARGLWENARKLKK